MHIYMRISVQILILSEAYHIIRIIPAKGGEIFSKPRQLYDCYNGSRISLRQREPLFASSWILHVILISLSLSLFLERQRELDVAFSV